MLEALEDGLGDPSEYVPVLREQVVVLSLLVDDLPLHLIARAIAATSVDDFIRTYEASRSR